MHGSVVDGRVCRAFEQLREQLHLAGALLDDVLEQLLVRFFSIDQPFHQLLVLGAQSVDLLDALAAVFGRREAVHGLVRLD